MPNYETLDGFKKKLKNGVYENVTGARRAIGKMRTWEDADKDAARRAVDRHFGAAPAEPAAPKKAVAKKPAAAAAPAAPAAKQFDRKKRPSKPAKKVAVKKSATKEVVAAPVEKAATKAAAPKKAPPKKSAPKKAAPKARASSEHQTKLQAYQERMDLYELASGVLKTCASAEVNVTEGLTLISESVTKLLAGIDAQLVVPLTTQTLGEQKASELLARTAPPRSNGAGVMPPMMTPAMPPVPQA